MHRQDYDVDDHPVEISIDYDYVYDFENVISTNDHDDDDDDDDVVDATIDVQTKVNDDNYDRSNAGRMSYEHPYRCPVLEKKER